MTSIHTFVIRHHCVKTCTQCVKKQALVINYSQLINKKKKQLLGNKLFSFFLFFFEGSQHHINGDFATVFVITEQQHMLVQSITHKTQPEKWKCFRKIQRHLNKKQPPTCGFAARLFSASSFNRDTLPLLEPRSTVQLVFDCGQCKL